MTVPSAVRPTAEHHPVSTLELFFDLVFVFALSQLSAHLVEDLSARGLVETVVMSLTVFIVWSYTTYESTMSLVGDPRLGRWVILGAMALGLVMNASIPSAFGENPWSFIVPMILIQVGRSLATRRLDPVPELASHRINMAAWALGSGALWVMGAAADPETRLWWWVAAAAVDVVGTLTNHPVPGRGSGAGITVGFDVAHQVERCQLFLIICLGEAVLTTGSGLIPHPQDPGQIVVALLSMGVIVSVWFLFFGIRNQRAEDALEERQNDLRVGEIATQGQQILVLGLVGFAVGNEVVSHEPGHAVEGWPVAVMFGGIVVCTLAFWTYLGAVTGRWAAWPSLLVGAGALTLAAVAAWFLELPGWSCLAILLVLMAGTCLAYARDARRVRPSGPSAGLVPETA